MNTTTPTLNIDKSNWKKYRFDEVCRQVNESSKNPAEDGLVYVIGLEHIEPNNLHITQWDTLQKAPRNNLFNFMSIYLYDF